MANFMANKSEKKFIQIHIYKALGILAGAVIVSIVSTTFAVVNLLNTDHFTVISLNSTVGAIPTTYVRQDVYIAQQQTIVNKLDTLNSSIQRMSQGACTQKI